MSKALLKEWIRKAEEDYEVILTLSRKKGRATPDAICFHAQQCAEKYLKAFLVAHKKPFPKTHILTELLKLCIQLDSGLKLIRDVIVELTPYAVEFRYPGEEATKKEALLALKAAKEARSFLRSKIQ